MLFKWFYIALCINLGLLPSLSLATSGSKPGQNTFPNNQYLYDRFPNAVLYYYGITVSDALVRIFEGDFNRWPEHVQSIEYTRTLPFCNVVRQFFYPIAGVVQLNANLTYRVGSNENNIYEFDPYMSWRWANFFWNKWVNTSLAIGEGISYASSIPWLEKKTNVNTKRLLNYLMLEATLAPPIYPKLQLVIRIHHRSGAYGLYRAGNTGSNAVGLGLRYLF